MGLIEWLNGWEYLGKAETSNKNISKEIIDLAKNKASKIYPKVAGNTMHQGWVYHTLKGERMASHVPSFKFHIKGKTFIYRIKHLRLYAAEGNGHGLYIGGGMKVWRKLNN